MYDLPCLVAATRRRRRLTLKQAAAEMGCAIMTVHRVENGLGCHIGTLIALLAWMGKN